MSGSIQHLTQREQEKAKAMAAAMIQQRRNEGLWGGTVKAHTEYARRPLDWIVTYLEVPEETLRWSLNPGYENHCVPEGDVLTPDGWRDIREMSVGDPIYTVDRTGHMVKSVVEQVHQEHFVGKLLHVEGRRLKVLATPNHRIAKCGPSSLRQRYEPVGTPRDGKGIKETATKVANYRECTYEAARMWTRKLRTRGYEDVDILTLALTDRKVPLRTLVPISEFPQNSHVERTVKWHGEDLDDVWVPPVRRMSALHKTKAPQPTSLNPTQYASLLGWYLAEGSAVDRDKAISIAQMKPEGREAITALLDNCGFRYSKSATQFTIYAPRWWNHFRIFGKAGDKYIPRHMKHAKPDVLEALLAAMMAGDGHWRYRGRSGTYASISRQLADDFGEVALRLGYSVYQRQVEAPDPTRRRQYHVSITKKKTIWPGKEHRRYVDYDGPVYCIGVPDTHTFIIRQNGSVWISGNSWDGDVDPLIQVLDALAGWHDVGIEAATGVGKTFLAACITLWFLGCHTNALVAQWAPTERQLLLFMWKEIGRLFPLFKKHFPQAEMFTGVLRMLPADDSGKETWAAKAFVAGVRADEESATKAQGFHGVHTLHITEETPGIPDPIMVAIKETRTADHNLHLALGNPDHRHDQLHRFCMRPRVKHIRISALDFPNVVSGLPIVPGAVDRSRLEERIEDLGKGSRLYLSRIRGISPAQAEDALIQHEWCVAAAEKYNDKEYRVGAEALGVDVANSEHGDEGAIARWKGSCLTEIEAFPCPDSNLLGKRVFLEMEDRDIDPRYVGVDPVGVGAGTVNELKRLGVRVRHLGGGNKAIPGLDTDVLWSETEPNLEGHMKAAGPVVVEAERFVDLRSQIWWRMREDLRLGRVALPLDDELFSDLTLPTFGTRNGKIYVQSKEDIIRLLRRSPNKGDAACYGNWVRRRTPVRIKREQPMNSTENRDRGLERFLHLQNRRQIREQRELLKRLKARARRVGRR